MANEDNKAPQAGNDTKPKAAEAKAVSGEAAAKLARQNELTEFWGIGQPTGNLTRDSIISSEEARQFLAGKSREEAQKLAVKRGLEMIPE